MYVCVCNAITDKQIRKAAKAGVTDLWGLQAELGVASNCGSCSELASEILAEYRQPRSAAARRAPRGHVAGDHPAPGPQVYVPALA